jgi:hypothetical protein
LRQHAPFLTLLIASFRSPAHVQRRDHQHHHGDPLGRAALRWYALIHAL